MVDLTRPSPPSPSDDQRPARAVAEVWATPPDAEGHPTAASLADRVVAIATVVVPCEGAAALLPTAARKAAAAATSRAARQALRLRTGPGTGLHLEEVGAGGHVLVRDTTIDGRWPDWAEEAAALGFRSVAVIPVVTGRGRLGRLELYSADPDAFDAEALLRATELGGLASLALDVAHDRDGLRQALEARGHIGMAMGILVERYGLGIDAAFQVLVRYSQHHNLKLREVASLLVESGDLPDSGLPDDDLVDP